MDQSDELNNLNNITEKVKEYAEISKTIKLTQEKLKVLNKKKKELQKEVVPKLKTSNVTKCNLPYGTLNVTKTKRKILPTKTTIKDKYLIFFNTRFHDHDFLKASPQDKVEILWKFLYVDNIEYKEEHTISMTYNKEFKNQCKQLQGF
jgi:hypothetical protein